MLKGRLINVHPPRFICERRFPAEIQGPPKWIRAVDHRSICFFERCFPLSGIDGNQVMFELSPNATLDTKGIQRIRKILSH